MAAAGSGRERGRAAGLRLPVGARTKPQLRLLCPFQTAFVPITSGPAAIWAEAARSARGPRPSLAGQLAAGPGRPPDSPLPTSPFTFEENGMSGFKTVIGDRFSCCLNRVQTSPPNTPIWTDLRVWRGKGGGRGHSELFRVTETPRLEQEAWVCRGDSGLRHTGFPAVQSGFLSPA